LKKFQAGNKNERKVSPNVDSPYFKFHPTLAPAVWPRLSSEEQTALSARHRKLYYTLSASLCYLDNQNPDYVRDIAQREVRNLLQAVNEALTVREKWAVKFAEYVSHFLNIFGYYRSQAKLSQLVETATSGAVDSYNWYIAYSNRGVHLLSTGRYQQAQVVFEEILERLETSPNYELCRTLDLLGLCLEGQCQRDLAENHYRRSLAVAQKLEVLPNVRRLMATVQTHLADLLTDKGDYDNAQTAYLMTLTVHEELDDRHSVT